MLLAEFGRLLNSCRTRRRVGRDCVPSSAGPSAVRGVAGKTVKSGGRVCLILPNHRDRARMTSTSGLIKAAQAEAPIKVAVAHPCDDISLGGAVEAARLRLIEPILVGPEARIRDVASRAGLDISSFETVTSEHSYDSAVKAVELVTSGRVEGLMKGSLHTDELMGAVVSRQAGIRTARRISHCFIMDVPRHPDALVITDAAINIAPTLDDKADIVQNAIDLAHAMGVAEVRVAILSAMETVNAKVPSTIEAAALCKMADRGQITGAQLDGPLALDNAISLEAAAVKQIASAVAGRANILVVPDLEIREYAGEEPVFPGAGRCGRHCARRTRSDHPDQSRGLTSDTPCVLCGCGHGRCGTTPIGIGFNSLEGIPGAVCADGPANFIG